MLFIVLKISNSLHVPCMAVYCFLIPGCLCHSGLSGTGSDTVFLPDVLVYMLMCVSEAQLGGKDSTHVQRRVLYDRFGEDSLVLSVRVPEIQ